MPTETEQLVVALEARIRDFERNFQKANRTANDKFTRIEKRAKLSGDRLESTMGRAASRMSVAMRAGLAGIFAGGVVGVGARIAEIAGGIAQIGDEAKRAGLNVKAFQELKYVAEQNRIGVDSLVDGIKELNLRADEFITTGGGSAAEAFQRLGFTADELKAKLKDPSTLFTEIIGKLEKLDRAAGIRIADEVFGGTAGEKFVQLIDQGERAIRDQIKAANDLGVVLDEELIARADEVDRKFRAITTTVSTSLKRSIVEAASALQTFIDTFRDIERQQSRTLNERVTDIGRERLEIENRILELKEKQTEIGGFTAEAERRVLQGTINELSAQSEQLAQEEARILSILESRRVPDVSEPTPPTQPPDTEMGGRTSTSRARSVDNAERERQAVIALIAELEDELRLIGATDEERRAAEASRRAGSAATEEQRQRIIALNEAIHQEGAALDTQRGRMQSFADTAKDFISGFRQDIMNGVPPLQALGNAIGRLSDRIFDELLTALLEVKEAGGGGGLGGIFGWLFKFFGFASGGKISAGKHGPKVQRQAYGGMISGAGGPRDDRVPVLASDGEFIVNADATRRHRQLLETVNSGRTPVLPKVDMGGSEGSVVRSTNNVTNTFAPTIPITVQASGNRETDAHMAKRLSQELDALLEAKMTVFMQEQLRPGNPLRRGRKFGG